MEWPFLQVAGNWIAERDVPRQNRSLRRWIGTKKIPDRAFGRFDAVPAQAGDPGMDARWHMDLYPADHVVADPGAEGGP